MNSSLHTTPRSVHNQDLARHCTAGIGALHAGNAMDDIYRRRKSCGFGYGFILSARDTFSNSLCCSRAMLLGQLDLPAYHDYERRCTPCHSGILTVETLPHRATNPTLAQICDSGGLLPGFPRDMWSVARNTSWSLHQRNRYAFSVGK
jgi:hypothetical protein